MDKSFKSVWVALALAGASLTGAMTVDVSPAHAASVSFDVGDVAIGYSDGYWDHDHHWHKWQSAKHRQAYQHADGAEYHASSHRHAPNGGWHDK